MLGECEMNAIEFRKSVRNYQPQPLTLEDVEKIHSYINNRENLIGPHGNEIKLKVILDSDLNKNEKIGTYGVIRNAQGYILGSCQDTPEAIFDYAYVLEGLVLILTSNDIGTCWIAGTFDRKEMLQIYPTSADEIIPAITPIGYAMDGMHFRERMMRQFIKADHRKQPEQLFFYGDLKTPLNDRAKMYIKALNYVRLAPSAKNNQPWRIVVSSDFSKVHFYILKSLGDRAFACAPEYIDIGIAYRHFLEGINEEGLQGNLVAEDPKMKLSVDMEYIATWVKK
jgi:nitroreductase